jgi:RNA polymerase sigma-70 factor, ECF subfamily
MLGNFHFGRGRDGGEWAAFEEEALPHLPELFRFAMWRLRDRAAAEDLVQETMFEALRSFHRFRRGTNCRAWLVTIMNRALSKRRRADARLQLVSETAEQLAETLAFDPPAPSDYTEAELLGALRLLPERFQEVVILSDVQELSYKETAAALGIPIGTVMSRLHRGHKMLRAALAGAANARGGVKEGVSKAGAAAGGGKAGRGG